MYLFWEYGYFSKEGFSSLEAEIRAIGMAVDVVAQKNWVSAVIISDCQVAVNAFAKRRCPDWKCQSVRISITLARSHYEDIE
ncbi:hypothetical protein G4B88_001498 [Cannabis sativa]|uniref:RNase H type-1 domain-containing protein n=1 Tax=Cannabis sativa TaxID=3483 RepID=A0A7J6FMZ5_CANSA|nr:hypothetical protein G4B88_001498 [Cannabis sativa]